ncbi:MAG: hypothetical protein LBB24_02260, partial [Rickettsiales bacterium]|nr:hypothetical protein [Rickettsiales bacterium]
MSEENFNRAGLYSKMWEDLISLEVISKKHPNLFGSLKDMCVDQNRLSINGEPVFEIGCGCFKTVYSVHDETRGKRVALSIKNSLLGKLKLSGTDARIMGNGL